MFREEKSKKSNDSILLALKKNNVLFKVQNYLLIAK